MMNTARIMDGTSLYVSELSNGLVCTLRIRDSGRGEHEKHIWSTSYPLLDHLYPHWVGKQSSNSKIDFLSKALKKAEEAFGWKFMLTSKRFRIPEERFGEGVSRVVLYKDSSTKGFLDEYEKDTAVNYLDRSSFSLGKVALQAFEAFDTPVVLVVLNFMSIELVECIPKFIGNYKRWEYKVSKIVFDTPQEFVDHISQKRFMPFIGHHIEDNHILNTLLNYTYWKPLKTSSAIVSDIFRSLSTSLLNELSGHTSVGKIKEGHLIVTGEIPLFMQDNSILELAVVDGLGLSGLWNISVDNHSYVLPLMLSGEKGIKTEIMGDNSKLWIIPQVKRSDSIVSVSSGANEYKAVTGNLYTYSIHEKLHDAKYSINTSNREISNSLLDNVKALTFDLRPWPVVYGPNAMVNSERVPVWLDRIKNRLEAK